MMLEARVWWTGLLCLTLTSLAQSAPRRDLEMTAEPLSSSTIRVKWTKDVDGGADNPYRIMLDPTPATGFGEAEVICVEPSIYCYGYFTDLLAGEIFAPTVTSPDGVNSVTAPAVTLPPEGETDLALAIESISPKPLVGDRTGTNLKICFTGNSVVPAAPTDVTLSCGSVTREGSNPLVEINVPAISIDPDAAVGSMCSDHETTETLTTGTKLKCFISLHVEDEPSGPSSTETGVATYAFIEYNDLSPCSRGYSWSAGTVIGLMCTEPSGVSGPSEDFTKIGSSDNIAYFKHTGEPDVSAGIAQCIDVPNEEVDPNPPLIKFCGGDILVADAPAGGLSVTTVNLVYGDTDPAVDNKLVVTASDEKGKLLDLVLVNDNKAATGTTPTHVEVTVGEAPGETEYLVVSYDVAPEADPAAVKGSFTGSHTDLEVTAEALSGTILQIQWSRSDDEADNPYNVTLHPTPSAGFGEAEINCVAPSVYCLGYFTGLPAGDTFIPTVASADGIHRTTAAEVTLPLPPSSPRKAGARCTSATSWEAVKTVGVACSPAVTELSDYQYIDSSDHLSYFTYTADTPPPIIACTDGASTTAASSITPTAGRTCSEVPISPAPDASTTNLKVDVRHGAAGHEDVKMLTVTGPEGEGGITDFVFLTNAGSDAATTLPTPHTELPVGASNDTQYLVVKYDATSDSLVVKTTATGSHTDFGLRAEGIASDIIELAWRVGDMSDNPFNVTILDSDYPEITVDCSHSVVYCYVYVLNLDEGDYTARVTSVDAIHSVTTPPVTMPPSPPHTLA